MFTDSHTHLNDAQFAADLPAVLTRARDAGVKRFIVPATSRNDWARTAELAAPDILPAFGIHPWFAHTAQTDDFAVLHDYLAHHPQAAVGEIGLDYRMARNDAARQIQIGVLNRQLAIAADLRRFVILHNVRASAALCAALKPHAPLAGIVHAFSGSIEEAQAFIRAGLFIGIGSLLLNPAAKKVRAAAQQLPLSSVVLETDSPFMLGTARNEPANTAAVAAAFCRLRGISPAALSAATEANINRLWPPPAPHTGQAA
ncbi:TatD family hydrolase [Neisseria leonii]|uniref:TatD family hydrolase n=1 Tax=Neisseria leonii TaxID=2995413 RepID=A0A9X4E8E8_9NEIS|nr:TatD family hydrolase [Neisseria sp. 51.81]MDD9327458.1 TatD family hydrolase [Neisseria sp. 51.81]